MKRIYSTPFCKVQNVAIHHMIAESITFGKAGSYNDGEIGAKGQKDDNVWGNGRGW